MYDGIPYNLFLDTDLCRVSVDNIRLKFTYKYNNFDFDKRRTVASVDAISALLDRQWFTGLDIVWNRRDFFSIGAYCRTCVISGNDFSFAVMVGRYCYDNSVKLVAPEALMDFNPNKVPMDVITRVVELLRGSALSCNVQRYDVAFDFALPRDEIRLVENKAKRYELYRDGTAITEYQGARSTHGALKLYDKTKECGLTEPVTRCELTVDGGRGQSLSSVFPELYRYGASQLDLCFSELPFEVQACILHPEMVELLRSSCNRHTFRKYMDIMRSWGKITLAPDNWPEIDRFVRRALYSYTKGVTA